jgi:SsrA-binding protein
MGIKVISKNRKAFHEYEIGETYEAGIALVGTEVKSLRAGKVNLQDGWVEISSRKEAVLQDVVIGHYTHGNIFNHEEKRKRKLLLHKHELLKLSRSVAEKGYSLIPIKIYFKDSMVKVEIALGKGKKSHDKRESAKEKDAKHEMAKALKKR